MERRQEITRRDFLRSTAFAGIVAHNPGLILNSHRKKEEVIPQNLTFYFPTGHNLEGPFSDFWRSSGGLEVFGNPISEQSSSGIPIQYFEKARMEYHPENPPAWRVQLGLLGSEIYGDRTLPFINNESPEGENKFKLYRQRMGGPDIFGNPLSAPFLKEGRLVQIFERAEMSYRSETLGKLITSFNQDYYYPVPQKFYQDMEKTWGTKLLFLDEVELADLGTQAAKRNGIPTAPVAPKPGAIDYSTYNPIQRIEVSQIEQGLTAYEDDFPVMFIDISSGRPSARTDPGIYKVMQKIFIQTYDYSDEFGKPYKYLAVPFNVQFYDQYLLHAAYWHMKFGPHPDKVPGFGTSRGCVNLPPDQAQRLYRWAKIGTQVIIGPHYSNLTSMLLIEAALALRIFPDGRNLELPKAA